MVIDCRNYEGDYPPCGKWTRHRGEDESDGNDEEEKYEDDEQKTQ